MISALVDKRARLDGEIKARRFQIMRLEVELAHVDAVVTQARYPGGKMVQPPTIRAFYPSDSKGLHIQEWTKFARFPICPLDMVRRLEQPMPLLSREQTDGRYGLRNAPWLTQRW